MKIQKIETFNVGQMLGVVKITTDEGVSGYGQTAPYHADITTTVLHRQIAPHALGWDVLDPSGLSERCVERNYKFPWSYVCRALAGIETAMWDVQGKVAGKSVCELLGGTPKKIKAYASSMRRDITPEDEADRLCRLIDSHGYSAFKIRVGSVCGHDEDQWPGRTEALVPCVRNAIGEDATLLVDGNSCYTPKGAIEVGKLLEDNNIGHFEEPCPYWELEWTAEVNAALSIPVAGGEQDNDLAQWRRMIAMDAVDIVQPDICYMGGISRTLEVARQAATANKVCVPHAANRSLVTVFTMHVLGAIANAGPHLEFSIEPTPWVTDFFVTPLDAVDGYVQIPDTPGWGFEVNPAWLEKANRQVSAL